MKSPQQEISKTLSADSVCNARCTRGFFAVVGKNPQSFLTQMSMFAGSESVNSSSIKEISITTFGTASGTLQLRKSNDTGVVVNGRPFHQGVLVPNLLLNTDTAAAELRNLDGRFALLAHNMRSGVAATDILGAGSLFWAVENDYLYLSTHLGLMLKVFYPDAPPKFDQLGIASLLCGNCGLHGRTPYEKIRRLRSCEYLCFNIGTAISANLKPRSYGNLADILLTDRFDGLSKNDRIDYVGRLTTEGIRREFLTGKIGLPLSGGRDSTSLAIAMRKYMDVDFEAITYGDPDSFDVKGAKATASKFKIPHHLVEYRNWDYSTFAERIIDFGGGAAGLFGGSILVGYQECEKRYNQVLSGYLGDVTTGSHLPKDRRATLSDAVATVFPNMRRNLLQQLYREECEFLKQEMEQRWNSYRSLSPAQAHMLIDLTERQTSWISLAFDLGETYVQVAHPLFTRSRLQFWFNRNLEDLQRQYLYDCWLAKELNGPAPKRNSPKRVLFNRLIRKLTRKSTKPAHVLSLVNWATISKKSDAWLRDVSHNCANDSRLAKLCDLELRDNWESLNEVPLTPTALAPALAIKWLCSRKFGETSHLKSGYNESVA